MWLSYYYVPFGETLLLLLKLLAILIVLDGFRIGHALLVPKISLLVIWIITWLWLKVFLKNEEYWRQVKQTLKNQEQSCGIVYTTELKKKKINIWHKSVNLIKCRNSYTLILLMHVINTLAHVSLLTLLPRGLNHWIYSKQLYSAGLCLGDI